MAGRVRGRVRGRNCISGTSPGDQEIQQDCSRSVADSSENGTNNAQRLLRPLRQRPDRRSLLVVHSGIPPKGVYPPRRAKRKKKKNRTARRNRRHLSRVPNAHSPVSRARSAPKIRNMDCALLSGRTGNVLLLDESSRWESNEIDSVDVSVLKLGPGANSASSSARSLFATLEQPRRFHPIRPGRECRRRTAPAQRLDLS